MKKSFIALFLMFVSVVSMAETSQGESFVSTSNDDNIARAEAGGDIVAQGSASGYQWTLDAKGNFVISGEVGHYAVLSSEPWKNYRNEIKTIKFKGRFAFDGSCYKKFADLPNVVSIDMGSYINNTMVYDMGYMYANCPNLVTVDLSGFWDTSFVQNMSYMFFGCRKLLTVNLSSFDTSSVVDMRYMFADCYNLVFVDITNFNIPKCQSLTRMFDSCRSLTEIDLSGMHCSGNIDASYMFEDCDKLKRVDVTDFFTNSGNFYTMFRNSYPDMIICDNIWPARISSDTKETLRTLRSSKIYVPPTLKYRYADYGWPNEMIYENTIVAKARNFQHARLDITGRVVVGLGERLYNFRLSDDFSGYFHDIKTVKFRKTNWSTNRDYDGEGYIIVDDFREMFANLDNLKTVYFGNIIETVGLTNMSGMFKDCKSLVCFNMPSFDTHGVNSVGSMFEGCSNLIAVNISNFNSNVNSMASMFSGCKSIVSLNISNINTSKVLTMNSMFADCGTSGYRGYAGEYYNPIPTFDLSNFDTSNVESMSWMFYGCSGLKSLDLSNLNTSRVTDMSVMFTGCSGLTSLDLSNLNTSRVTDMSYMFYGCTGLTYLDLSNFDTSYVSSMSNMFKNCNNLKTLMLDRFYVPDNSNGMFDGDNIENIIFKSIPRVADGSFNSLQDTKVTLNLTDASYIHEGPNNFPSVYKATYTRPVTNKWGTIVLPFNVRMGETYDFYQVKSIKNDNLNLKKISALSAGTPAIFCVNDGETKLTITSSGVDVSTELNTELAGELTLVGTFSELDLTNEEGFIIANNKFWNIQDIRGDNWVGIKPFRAYLAGSLSSGANSLGISFDDTEDVDAVEAISDVENGEMEYYDLNGRRLNELHRGVNIVKLGNGKIRKILVE